MAFSVYLQYNRSELNRVSKEVDTILTLFGTLKAETSIIDPIIIFEASMADLASCNYMTISQFRRSYFVRNIRSIRNGLIEISGHVDVLSSFASQIRGNSAIITKQENEWNLYLNDGSFKCYQNPTVITRSFPSGFTTQEFVLAVAGN